MLTDLLDELAREAPIDGAPPAQVWRHGRRVARTQRLGTIVIAAAAGLLLIVLGTATWQQRTSIDPAEDSDPGTYLPSRFHEPSPHLPGTDSVGPLGPLVATFNASRKGWFATSDGLVGVSAETGAYAFLDLPRAAPTFLFASALAPDGRHVAYWTTGTVPEPVPEPDREGETINGYAVYDTVTGEVVAQRPATRRGLGYDELIWFDSTHLGVGFGQMQDCCSSVDPQSLVFDLSTGHATDVDVTLGEASTNAVGSLITGRGSALVTPDGATTPIHVPHTAGKVNGTQFIALSPDTRRLAAIIGDGVPGPIYVTSSDTDTDTDGYGDRIPGTYLGVFCWLDQTHLAVLRRHDDDTRTDLVSLDIRDGSTEMLSEYVDTADLALDLIDSPVKTQPAPPRPRSPWVPTIAASVTIAAAAGGILAWRRRARA